MFYELDNVDVLFRLGGLPRIALLTAGHPGPFISICKKIKLILLLLLLLLLIYNNIDIKSTWKCI